VVFYTASHRIMSPIHNKTRNSQAVSTMRDVVRLWMGEMSWNLSFCFIAKPWNNGRTAPVAQLISCDVFSILRPLTRHVLYVTSQNNSEYTSLADRSPTLDVTCVNANPSVFEYHQIFRLFRKKYVQYTTIFSFKIPTTTSHSNLTTWFDTA